jgi:hypothetical protein
MIIQNRHSLMLLAQLVIYSKQHLHFTNTPQCNCINLSKYMVNFSTNATYLHPVTSAIPTPARQPTTRTTSALHSTHTQRTQLTIALQYSMTATGAESHTFKTAMLPNISKGHPTARTSGMKDKQSSFHPCLSFAVG